MAKRGPKGITISPLAAGAWVATRNRSTVAEVEASLLPPRFHPEFGVIDLDEFAQFRDRVPEIETLAATLPMAQAEAIAPDSNGRYSFAALRKAFPGKPSGQPIRRFDPADIAGGMTKGPTTRRAFHKIQAALPHLEPLTLSALASQMGYQRDASQFRSAFAPALAYARLLVDQEIEILSEVGDDPEYLSELREQKARLDAWSMAPRRGRPKSKK